MYEVEWGGEWGVDGEVLWVRGRESWVDFISK